MIRRTLLATAALGLGLALAGTASAQGMDKAKACFAYVGPVSDGGWSYQHDQGRLAAVEHFGDRLETVFIESVPESDAESPLTQMALSGCNIIFATSFGYIDAVQNVAAKFPNVKFEHATGYKREHDNVSTYDGRFYEGRAIAGDIAGRMTKTNKIGYIATFPIPEVVQGINSYYHHAKKANPDVELSVVWAYTWFDPAKEADAAKALIEQGVDVIAAHTNSTAPLAEAQKAGNVIGFGQASDMEQYKPAPRVTSVSNDWGPHYIARIGAVLDGTWEQAASWNGIGDGAVVIGEITEAVPAEVKASAETLRDKIAAKEYHPFTGPLNKADGTVWLKDGEVADDAALLGMNFFIEGITAELPK